MAVIFGLLAWAIGTWGLPIFLNVGSVTEGLLPIVLACLALISGLTTLVFVADRYSN